MSEYYYTPNNDPDYYESNSWSTNCGSYALRLKEWYDNELDEQVGGIMEWIEELIEADIPNSEIPDIMAEAYLDMLLNDFPDGEIILAHSITQEMLHDNNLELIAFRVYAPLDEYYDNDYCCFDFHFRVWREGHWMEKNGNKNVHQCTLTDWGKYNSSTFFLLHKISEKN